MYGNDKTHLLSGIVKCPVCGIGMYGNVSIKRKPDGTRYKDFSYYCCKHRDMTRGHKCKFRKQVNEELIISEIHIYEERQPNGRWIQSIKFKFPLISEDLNLGLEEQNRVESVVLLSR